MSIPRRHAARAAGVVLTLALLAIATLTAAGCAPTAVAPSGGSTAATVTAPATGGPSAGTTPAPTHPGPPGATTAKRGGTASSGSSGGSSVTKTSTAAALKKLVNAEVESTGASKRALVTDVDVRVLEQASNGTWWAGGQVRNDLDGGIVFAKRVEGGSWVIVDLGTGIDGSEMRGKAPAAIARRFEAEFPP